LELAQCDALKIAAALPRPARDNSAPFSSN